MIAPPAHVSPEVSALASAAEGTNPSRTTSFSGSGSSTQLSSGVHSYPVAVLSGGAPGATGAAGALALFSPGDERNVPHYYVSPSVRYRVNGARRAFCGAVDTHRLRNPGRATLQTR